MIDLTPEAKRICGINYTKNCGGCPLRPVCCAPTGYGQEKLDKWTQAVNELAEKIY